MAVSETARLIASLELKDLFTKQVDNATKSLGKLDKSIDSTQGRAYKAGAQIGTGIKRGAAIAVGAFSLLAANVALGVKSLEDVEKATAQTNAVLKSTKDVSGQTAEGIRAMSNEFESLNATMDDTSIQSGANVLLTFTNITQKAFKPALQAALDLSTAMDQDLQSSVVQIGKALNDPVKGLTALTRVGVSFTAEQKQQIKALAGAGDEAVKLADKINKERQALELLNATGKGSSTAADNLRTKIKIQSKAYEELVAKSKDTNGTFKAQQIILAELNKEFGGSFIGQGNTTAGKFAKVRDAVDDLQRALAQALLPALGKVATAISTELAKPEVIAAVSKLGENIAGLFSDQNLASAAGAVQGFIKTVVAAAPILEASAKATLGFVQTAVGVFNTLPDPIKGLLVGGFALNKLTGGLVTNIGGALLDLVGKSRGASPANPVFVSDVSGALGGAAGAAGGGLLRTIGTLITKLGGLALVGGGLAAVGAGTNIGGPAGAGVAAGGGAAAIAGGALLAGPLGAIVASLGVVGKTLLDIRDQSAHQGDDIAASIQSQVAGGATVADLRKSLDAVDQGINDIQANPLNVLVAGDALDQLRAQHDLLVKQIAAQDATAAAVSNAGAILDRGGKDTVAAISELSGKQHDDANYVADLLRNNGLRERAAIESLKHTTDPKKIADALKTVQEIMVAGGHGSVAATRETARAIREQLKHTHDPVLQAALRSALKAVEGKIPGREYAQRQIAKADSILHSGRSVEDKIRALQTIERDLKDHKLPGQTRSIREKIEALKQEQARKQQATTQAIKDKDLSVSLTNNITMPPITLDSKVIYREIRRSNRIFATPG